MYRRTLLATAGALLTAGLAGCGEAGPGADTDDGLGDGETGTEMPAGTADGDVDLGAIEGDVLDTPVGISVADVQLVRLENGLGVTGTVLNNSTTTFSLVEVEAYLSDGDDTIGEFTDTTERELSELEPDESWRFFLLFEDIDVSQVASYELNVDAEPASGSDETATDETATDEGTATDDAGTETATDAA